MAPYYILVLGVLGLFWDHDDAEQRSIEANWPADHLFELIDRTKEKAFARAANAFIALGFITMLWNWLHLETGGLGDFTTNEAVVVALSFAMQGLLCLAISVVYKRQCDRIIAECLAAHRLL